MSDFKAKKKMLLAESEVYRQLLKLEIQTFKIYGKRAKRRLTSAGSYMPLVMSGLPLLARLFKRKKKEGLSLQRIGSLFFIGWKAYRQFAPMLGLRKFTGRKSSPSETAAEEYLSKRI